MYTLIYLLCLVELVCLAEGGAFYKRLISIPNKAFDGELWMGCTALPVDPDQYVVEFHPLAVRGIVHHMSIHVCDTPHSTADVWDCVNPTNVCGDTGREALFEWGRSAPGWKLPDYAGIPTGNRSRHLVLQVHMLQEVKPSSVDGAYKFSGIELTLRDSRPQYEVAMAVYGNTGYIPPAVKGFTSDSACVWDSNYTVPIISYSVHTHGRGRAVTAWIYRNGTWIELGRGNPGYPEIVMDVSKRNMQLIPGDIVAVRCTFDNDDNKKVEFRSEHGGEMCNVYVHYGVPHEAPHDVRMMMCAASAQDFHWEDHFDTIPSRASDPSGNTDQAYYVKLHGLEITHY
ncbi:hypothetical protein ScPMuIL_016585 [Solemya velum]